MVGETWDDYERIVSKAATTVQKRTGREEEVENALGGSLPGILRRSLDASGGSVRPALRDLNGRLTEAGVESDVSPNTFYDWLDKYRLR